MVQRRVRPEPVRVNVIQAPAQNPPRAVGRNPATPPRNVDELIRLIANEVPEAQLRITGRGRTNRRQAELMAQRIKQNRRQFLNTYRSAQHITEMDQWHSQNPNASSEDTIAAFEAIIVQARARGAMVSNHLSDRARDIGIPSGGREVQQRVRRLLQQQGAHVIDERDAVGGPHWHVDY